MYGQQVTFNSGVEVTMRWPDFKANLAKKNLVIQHIENVDSYTVFALDQQIAYQCLLVKTAYSADFPFAELADDGYTQANNDADVTEFEMAYMFQSNQMVVLRNSKQRLEVSNEPRIGTELVMATHNFCDPTTWFSTSVRVDSATLTDSGDGLTFTSSDQNWVDLTHGKIFDEDSITQDVDHNYSVVVTADGVEMTQRTPFETTGGDYDVDYAAGTVTFFESQAGKAVVATYSKSVDSTWVLAPDTGMYIDIEGAKIAFSADLGITGPTIFEIWAYDPNNYPQKMMVGRTVYKKLENYVEEAVHIENVVPMLGGSPRGLSVPLYIFRFSYSTTRRLLSSEGIELRISVHDHAPLTGTKAAATFYCTVGALDVTGN